jgi:serine/threonine-protein kinase RsbW
MSPRLSLCLVALDATTPVILNHVDRVLAGTRFDAIRDPVHIALAEVLNNVIEHGYRDMPTGAVAVHVTGQNEILSIDVTDWGRPYKNHTLPNGILPDPEQLSEGGYGWFLIQTLVTSVAYERRASANHLSLRLAL